MTDKQIIYNCPHISFTDWGTYACKLYNPRDKNCLVKGGNCVSNISCPYKKLKHKEQECERLKEEKSEILKRTGQVETLQGYTVEDIDQLKAENENLKHILQTEFITVRATGKEPVLLYKGYELDKLINYKQAIEKIKEIANRTCSTVSVEVCDSYDSCADCGATSQYRKLTQILQICDEVNDE